MATSSSPRQKRTHLEFGLAVLRALAWTVCIFAVVGIAAIYRSATVSGQSPVQQVGAAADACAWMICIYIVARAIDGITRL
jgi:hypothetical protein